MTTNSSPKADDICGVCETPRDQHGDRQHEFRIDGQLVPKKKPEPARQSAPVHRDDPKPQAPDAHAAVIRLLEVLIEKGVLDAKDTLRVLGGGVTLRADH